MIPALGVLLASLPLFISYGQDPLKTREAQSPLVDREGPRKGGAEGTNPAAMVGWSVAVLGLLAAFLYGVKRWAARAPLMGGSGLIEVLARRRLTAGHEVVLVHVAGRVYLMAATSGGLSVLSEITERARVAELRAEAAPSKRFEPGIRVPDAPAVETAVR